MTRAERLGFNIRRRRRWCDRTQEYLGTEIGASQQRIAQFEKGEAVPDALQLQDIAEVLDTTTERLLIED